MAVRFEDKSLSIHQILTIYAGLPAPRPQIATQEGFLAMIKPLITPELMAIEAKRRGIAASAEFQNKLLQNRNALLRFHVHGAIEAQANEVLRGPGTSTRSCRAWYGEHAGALRDAGGNRRKQKPPYSENARTGARRFFRGFVRPVAGQKKRANCGKKFPVVIDEAVLKQL